MLKHWYHCLSFILVVVAEMVQTEKHAHTNTQTNYCNPCCAVCQGLIKTVVYYSLPVILTTPLSLFLSHHTCTQHTYVHFIMYPFTYTLSNRNVKNGSQPSLKTKANERTAGKVDVSLCHHRRVVWMKKDKR